MIHMIAFEGVPVVVHCSDGWDRTSQLTSLLEIVLDPYYRTMEGFEVLIEKEWLSFGHKFDQRVGHTSKDGKDSERSPIFLQFLDAVFQLLVQFPNAFEFNLNFLKTISNHLYSCCFGTFLFDSEMARVDAKLREKTISLWSHINYHKSNFSNPLYKSVPDILCSKFDFPLQFWKENYLSWNDYHTDLGF
eukprot:TRINITY_DN8277_c0_g1_i4.p1 TRINITY_DN8277_c0_g1~~TRINITY_DN8277_c0_g1_i4.p1  ORF type:complete len:190 (+),score=43.47 TRINITY_DN8277_c0_g1_i4:332-901(+)